MTSVSGELALEVVDSIDSLEALEPEWYRVWQSDPDATPFQSPDWLLPWTRHLWGGGKLRILALRHRDRLTAIAPFFLWGFDAGPGRLRLSFLGSGISDYLGPVCMPECRAEASAAVVRWLLGPRAEWSAADLQELRSSSPLLEAAGVEHLDSFECSACPVLHLRRSFGEQLSALDPHFRRSLQTAERRLRAFGKPEFVRGGEQNYGDLLSSLFELHARRWEQRGEPGMFSTENLKAFHKETADRMSRNGLLRLYGIAVEGRFIGVQYNFAAKGRVYAYQSGFDPEWARASPGAVILAHSIREAIGEGASEFDFLRHRAEFKDAWGAVAAPNRRLLLGSFAV
jgi:CelD/BcsL family acetyltransferase involved in cellulose biosynthesis